MNPIRQFAKLPVPFVREPTFRSSLAVALELRYYIYILINRYNVLNLFLSYNYNYYTLW